MVMWTTLLGACKIHGNVEMEKRVAKWVLEFESKNFVGYVLGYQAAMLLLARSISVRMLNNRGRIEM